jgi:hypothetical protein
MSAAGTRSGAEWTPSRRCENPVECGSLAGEFLVDVGVFVDVLTDDEPNQLLASFLGRELRQRIIYWVLRRHHSSLRWLPVAITVGASHML